MRNNFIRLYIMNERGQKRKQNTKQIPIFFTTRISRFTFEVFLPCTEIIALRFLFVLIQFTRKYLDK